MASDDQSCAPTADPGNTYEVWFDMKNNACTEALVDDQGFDPSSPMNYVNGGSD